MRMLKALAATAGVLLAGFHAWLLATQIAGGEMEPWMIFRWMIAAGLVAGLVAIHRQGKSIVGRKSIAIWVLAALIHGPAVVSRFGNSFETPAIPESVVTIVIRAVTIGVLAIGLWILAGVVAGLPFTPRLVARPVRVRRSNGILDVGHASRFSPRPPPASS